MKPKQKDKGKRATCGRTPPSWREMNRKQRREMTRRIQTDELRLEVVRPDAAGIDIGNESHNVAVPPSRDNQPVRRFGCTTAELKAMADWLKQCGIRTIAIQFHRCVLDRGLRLRFTLHLLADRMVRKGHAVPWPSGPGIFIQACVLIIIRMSAEQPMTLPSADGFQ